MEHRLKKKILEVLLSEKDNRRILIDKEGVSEDVANWAHNLSDKMSIWIVKSLKDKYNNEMNGVSPDNRVSLEDYYPSFTSDYQDILSLIKKQNRPQIDVKSLSLDQAMDLVGKYNYIEAWLNDPASPAQAQHGQGFLQNKSWDEAVAMADEWHQSLTAGGSVEDLLDEKDEIIHTFADGFMWVLRKSNTCPKSRESMGHCATATNTSMYLLRLVKDSSEFITVDWDPQGKFSVQIKGLNNKKPISKYHPYLVWLIKDWGGIEKLKTNTGYLPNTNFQLGELDPDVAAEIIGKNPTIMSVPNILEYTPTQNKAKLIANLFKYDSFVNKLIPNGFANFFNMVENKNMVIGAILKNPTFLVTMNKYKGYLTDTLERMINATDRKDDLIDALLKRDGLIDMLDGEGEDLLVYNHSNKDYVRDMLMQGEMMGDDDEEGMYESNRLREFIVTQLRKRLIK